MSTPIGTKPPPKVTQLRLKIYGPPKAKFDKGFPAKKEIAQLWMYLTDKEKEDGNLKSLDDNAKRDIRTKICSRLIEHWKRQEPPIIIDKDDEPNQLKLYKAVKALTENCDKMKNLTSKLKPTLRNKKSIEDAITDGEKVFVVPKVQPRKRNFEEV